MNRKELARAFLSLTELVSKLRGPGGCPWDARQTDRTIKMYLLEETYEVVEALERGSPDDICQELGDLLFQIIFLARLAEERGEFDLSKVMEEIRRKMITRHPHVFGEKKVETPEEVSENWEKIKKEEKESPPEPRSLLEAVPVHLPALLRAHRLSHKAANANPDRANPEGNWGRVEEDFRELHAAFSVRDKEVMATKLGDLLFSLANQARDWGLNAEDLLRDTNRRFIAGFENSGSKL